MTDFGATLSTTTEELAGKIKESGEIDRQKSRAHWRREAMSGLGNVTQTRKVADRTGGGGGGGGTTDAGKPGAAQAQNVGDIELAQTKNVKRSAVSEATQARARDGESCAPNCHGVF